MSQVDIFFFFSFLSVHVDLQNEEHARTGNKAAISLWDFPKLSIMPARQTKRFLGRARLLSRYNQNYEFRYLHKLLLTKK